MATDEAATSAAGRPLGAISTLISLFLLLLVFFILLFSVAQVHKQRVDEVVISIDEAFARIPSTLGLLRRPAPDALEATPEGFARSVSALITGFAPLAESRHMAPGGSLLEIDLPPGMVFEPGSAKLTPGAAGVLDRLAILLQHRLPDQRFRLTLRAVSPADDPAETLFAKGCPADALAVGLERGAGAAIRLDFTLVGKPVEAE
jgi:hypothetical protein